MHPAVLRIIFVPSGNPARSGRVFLNTKTIFKQLSSMRSNNLGCTVFVNKIEKDLLLINFLDVVSEYRKGYHFPLAIVLFL